MNSPGEAGVVAPLSPDQNLGRDVITHDPAEYGRFVMSYETQLFLAQRKDPQLVELWDVSADPSDDAPEDWRTRAVCRDEDPELFFPGMAPGNNAYRQQIEKAKAVCRRCPVIESCLEWALDERPWGISMQQSVWGGLTVGEIEDVIRSLGNRRRQIG